MIDRMRRLLFVVAGVGVLAALGWSVRDFEKLIASGEEVLLALAPVDPRSLMQGDYMQLDWALEREPITLGAPQGTIVIGLDARRIARFLRVGDAPAASGELVFHVRSGEDGDRVLVEPHSFLFEEGDADLYAQARYGIFRVDARGRHLLTGLADAEAKRIGAP